MAWCSWHVNGTILSNVQQCKHFCDTKNRIIFDHQYFLFSNLLSIWLWPLPPMNTSCVYIQDNSDNYEFKGNLCSTAQPPVVSTKTKFNTFFSILIFVSFDMPLNNLLHHLSTTVKTVFYNPSTQRPSVICHRF